MRPISAYEKMQLADRDTGCFVHFWKAKKYTSFSYNSKLKPFSESGVARFCRLIERSPHPTMWNLTPFGDPHG